MRGSFIDTFGLGTDNSIDGTDDKLGATVGSKLCVEEAFIL
jgi:hypothetical protein